MLTPALRSLYLAGMTSRTQTLWAGWWWWHHPAGRLW